MASVSHRTTQLLRKALPAQSNYIHLTKVPAASTSRKDTPEAHKPVSRNVALRRKLFTPGPLMISDRVKQAMLTDLERRHADFPYMVKFVQNSLLQIAKVVEEDFMVIPLSGSATFATEMSIRSMLANTKSKIVVMENGMFGKQIAQMCSSSGISTKMIPMNISKLQDTLLAHSDIGGVVAVHCETSTGMINPIDEIGRVIKQCSPDCLYFVDAVSSFGVIEQDLSKIDFLIGNSYKCLQSAPGISFVMARREILDINRSKANGLVMDIFSEYNHLEKTGSFRYTPPIHVMLAFKEALLEYFEEGGMEGRLARFKENTIALKKGMSEMGFNQLFKDEENPQGNIVTSYLYPNHPLFIVDEFSNRLSDSGHVVCTKRMNGMNCFRIGCIGHMFPDDVRELVVCIRQVFQDMRIQFPLDKGSF